MVRFDFLIVGAGLAGAVLAERIATQLNQKVLIVEKRDHIGGNCYDYRNVDGILAQKRVKLAQVENSRDVVVSRFGEELYEAFVEQYTKKQWGRYPEELDKSILERLVCRYDRNPCYFADIYQGMPASGYTKMFERMLDNRNIQIRSNTDFFKIKKQIKYGRLIYTGRLDQFFNYQFGHLDYRGIHFAFENIDRKSYQPHCVVNHSEMDVEYSRVTEFKKFYDRRSSNTVICKEYFGWDGEPCYPVLDWKNRSLLKRYNRKINALKNVIFFGGLARFKYLNMDQVVEESLDAFEAKVSAEFCGSRN